MSRQILSINKEVTQLIDGTNHPLKAEINKLREIILGANKDLSENIKWNGPNYTYCGEDRITMRIHPPKQLQLIFHRGAKVLVQPTHKLIDDKTGLLQWKTNDRAVATFRNREDIEACKTILPATINQWLSAPG